MGALTVRARAAVLCAVAACARSPEAAPRVIAVTPPADAGRVPEVAVDAPRPDAGLPTRARFTFVRGAPTLTASPLHRTADVTAGPDAEVLGHDGGFATVDVPERGGAWIADLGARARVTALDAMTVLGGAKKEIVLRWTQDDDDDVARADWAAWAKKGGRLPEVHAGAHMIVEVWSFAGEAPALLFAHEEQVWAMCCGSEIGPAPPRVGDEVVFSAPGTITLKVHAAWRADGRSWQIDPFPDVEPVLLAWGSVKERGYRFDGARFVLAYER